MATPLDPYDSLLKIPPDVIKSAVTVRKWVEANMAGTHDINIYGVGVRTFLSVQDMMMRVAPEVRISELKDDAD